MRRARRVRAALCAAAALATSLALAPRGAAAADFSTGGVFLPLGHGARAHGLGGAGVPIVRDDGAAYWCPSNLAWLEPQTGFTFMHAQIFPDVGSGYETLSFARRSGNRLGGGDQALLPSRWAAGVFFGHLGLDFDTSGWSENRVTLAGAFALNNFTSLGAAVRYLGLSTDFDAGDAHGGGLDLSLSILVARRLFAAVVGRDLWTRVKFDTETWETQEPSIDFGLEYRVGKRGSAVGELVFREGTLRRTIVGLEWRPLREALALRGGWSLESGGESRSFPSAGAGIRFRQFGLDYGAAFEDDDALGVTQRVSLHVGL
jgi:hypothetical protein